MSKLQLEVGKSYLNRKGDVVYIIGNDEFGKYPFYDKNDRRYKVGGEWGYTEDNWRDLIREVPCDYDFEMGAQHDDDAANNPSGIEAMVCADIASRQAKGIAKYGQTVADNPIDLRAWLQHQYEELLDAAVYCRRAIEELKQ